MSDFSIENYVPEGYNNAISRENLQIATGLSDRENRKLILEAIERGVPIVNTGKGYFIPDGSTLDTLAANEYFRKELARHKSVVHRIRVLEEALANRGQEVLNVE